MGRVSLVALFGASNNRNCSEFYHYTNVGVDLGRVGIKTTYSNARNVQPIDNSKLKKINKN